MRTSHVLAIFALFALCAAGGAFYLRTQNKHVELAKPSQTANTNQQTFLVRGKIITLNPDSGIVKIAHEEIPNYMPAMTMPFLVRDSKELQNLKVGDTVRFQLAVTDDDSWISRITKEENSFNEAIETVQTETDSALKSGETVPNFTFVDENGKRRSLEDYNGKFVILTFIYTRCPLPNFCPLLGKKFAELQDRLSKEFPGKFHLLSITIDPAHDTPQVLKGYSNLYSADPDIWTFATGSAEEISTIAQLFGLVYSEKSPGLIDHDMRTALISPKGRVVHVWKSNFWTAYEVRNFISDKISSPNNG